MRLPAVLFPNRPELQPKIYAYSDANYPGCLKVGYTTREVLTRIEEQYPVKTPHKPYKIVLQQDAIREDGTTFTDKEVHRVLESRGVERVGGEWFRCDVAEVKSAIVAVKTRDSSLRGRTADFKARPEQEAAVKRTIAYFESAAQDGRVPKFLWNAKMRFGKTFAAYLLAKRLGLKRVLILTFKPSVQTAWRDDLETHVEFDGWQFIAQHKDASLWDADIDAQYNAADKKRPIVCFGSFQDFLGYDKKTGSIKPKNEWVHALHWDLVIFDEYHFGAWRDNAKKLFDDPDEEKEYDDDAIEKLEAEVSSGNIQDENWLPITSSRYLFLSGTPFRALNSGEFIEEQIYNWTYADEQRAKEDWNLASPNPYASLPQMVMMTYRIPESVRKIALKGEFNEFDLNVFFEAEGKGESARFKLQDYVQKWLDLIRGAYLPSAEEDLKLGNDRPPMPFSDERLLGALRHTLWFLPSVAACEAMRNLLQAPQNVFYSDYKINVCAGAKAGVGAAALAPVVKSMGDPLKSKTITLTCGKLTTGSTVRPWTGVFMLRNLKSPETYFQTAFRVQSPWEVDGDDGKKTIVKSVCYLFDFALDRALKQICDYSCRLNVETQSPEKKVREFIGFLPVLAYDGAAMRRIDAAEILDYAMTGSSATLLAKRWESALLVNVDNATLERVLNNERALAALSNIEGLRSLNEDIETIINKSEIVKKAKKEGEEKTKAEKDALSEEEKEYKKKRKLIQEKLIKLAARLPIFMYLSDYREECLRDVIELMEPKLFEKATGLVVEDFQLLCELKVFNTELMNDAVYKFKRYEDASLTYSGFDSHENDKTVGGFDSTMSVEEYRRLYALQQTSLTSP